MRRVRATFFALAGYRLFDYGRGRELHLDDALNVTNIARTDLGLVPLPVGLRVVPYRAGGVRFIESSRPFTLKWMGQVAQVS